MNISTIRTSVLELSSTQKITSEKVDNTTGRSSQAQSQPPIVETGEQAATDTKKGEPTQESSASSSASALSPAQAILKRLSEQIAELREKVAEMKAELSKAISRANGEPSAEVDAVRNQLEGVQNQLTSLTGAYNDALNELNKSTEPKALGSIVDTSQ